MAKSASVAALLALAPAAAAAQPVSTPQAIVDAAADCWQAVGPKAIDQAGLAAKGWMPGEMKDKDGKAIASPLKFMGKPGSGVMLITFPDSKAPGCTAMSRVDSVAAYKTLGDLLLNRMKSLEPGLKAGRNGPNGIALMGGNRIALLELTGSKDKPAARIVVGYSASEKK